MNVPLLSLEISNGATLVIRTKFKGKYWFSAHLKESILNGEMSLSIEGAIENLEKLLVEIAKDESEMEFK